MKPRPHRDVLTPLAFTSDKYIETWAEDIF